MRKNDLLDYVAMFFSPFLDYMLEKINDFHTWNEKIDELEPIEMRRILSDPR